MPADERAAIERHLGLISQINEALRVVEADIAVHALQDPTIRRLMTLPGLDVTVAASVAAAIGDIRRFGDPQRLVAYFGLNPSVRQSGEGPAYHGRITKQGRGHARGMLVEAAWAAALAGSSTRLLQADRLASREAHRGRRHCAQACNDHLADAESRTPTISGPGQPCSPASSDRSSCAPASRLAMPGAAPRSTTTSRPSAPKNDPEYAIRRGSDPPRRGWRSR